MVPNSTFENGLAGGGNAPVSAVERMEEIPNPLKTWWRGLFFVEAAREEASNNGGDLAVAYSATVNNFLKRFPDVEDLGAGAMRSTVETYIIIKLAYPNAIVDISRD